MVEGLSCTGGDAKFLGAASLMHSDMGFFLVS